MEHLPKGPRDFHGRPQLSDIGTLEAREDYLPGLFGGTDSSFQRDIVYIIWEEYGFEDLGKSQRRNLMEVYYIAHVMRYRSADPRAPAAQWYLEQRAKHVAEKVDM